MRWRLSNQLIDHPIPHEGRIERVLAALRTQFGRDAEGVAEAPGRVNLIGEHVDYNDGLVLPFAIDRSVLAAWARRDDDAVWAYSLDFNEHSRFNLSNVTAAAPGAWANYVRGVSDALVRAGHAPGGLDLAIAGDVPLGAGLSSSAAVEVALAGAFRAAYDLQIDDIALAKLAQRAENEFVGVQSGIMDQFASALSQPEAALLIDCRTLEYRAVPLQLAAAGLTVVIANSAVQRELVKSAYNERRAECVEAVALLRARLGRDVRSLRDVSAAEVAGAALPDPIGRRARHVVTEIGRVEAAATALAASDFGAVGALMMQSHASLRDDYEVSSPQLDSLVELAAAREYVTGARLTGAGFGGCTINLVRSDALDAFAHDVVAPYREQTGLPAVMYTMAPQAGLRVWRV